jgi:periplasmic protein TonB
MLAKDNNNMGIANLSFPAGHSKYFQGNGACILNRNVMTAILLSLIIHMCGGWVFLQVEKVEPSQRRMLPIEVTIVTPKVIPLPLPILPKPPQPKPLLKPKRLPVPVVPPKVTQQEIKKTDVKTVQPSQPLPVVKALAGSQQQVMPSFPRSPTAEAVVNTSRLHNSSEGLPVIAPSYDAAYLSNPVPQYPAVARRLKIQGTATIRVLVSPEGRAKTVKLERTSGARILDDAALDAVQHWLFVPARRGDKPIAAEVNVPVRFRLN